MCATSANRLRLHAVLLAASAVLSACTTVGPDFKPPEVRWLDAWTGGSLESLSIQLRGSTRSQTQEWWRNFNDPALDQLIAEAQRVNPNVRTAGIRIMEARAQLGIAGSTLYPQVQQVTGDVLWAGEKKAGAADISARVNQVRADLPPRQAWHAGCFLGAHPHPATTSRNALHGGIHPLGSAVRRRRR